MNKVFQKFFATSKALFNSPKEVFASLEDDKKMGPHVKFLAILWLIGSILSALGSILFVYLMPLVQQKPVPEASAVQRFITTQILGIPIAIVVGIIVTFIGTAILHGWIKLFRGKGTFLKTFEINVYSMVPGVLFGWVPIASIVASFYGIYLTVIGIEKLHKVTRKKALVIVIALYVIAFFVGFFISGLIPRPQG